MCRSGRQAPASRDGGSGREAVPEKPGPGGAGGAANPGVPAGVGGERGACARVCARGGLGGSCTRSPRPPRAHGRPVPGPLKAQGAQARASLCGGWAAPRGLTASSSWGSCPLRGGAGQWAQEEPPHSALASPEWGARWAHQPLPPRPADRPCVGASDPRAQEVRSPEGRCGRE